MIQCDIAAKKTYDLLTKGGPEKAARGHHAPPPSITPLNKFRLNPILPGLPYFYTLFDPGGKYAPQFISKTRCARTMIFSMKVGYQLSPKFLKNLIPNGMTSSPSFMTSS